MLKKLAYIQIDNIKLKKFDFYSLRFYHTVNRCQMLETNLFPSNDKNFRNISKGPNFTNPILGTFSKFMKN